MLTRSLGATDGSVLATAYLQASRQLTCGNLGFGSGPGFVGGGGIEPAQPVVRFGEIRRGPARVLGKRARRGNQPFQALRDQGWLPALESVRRRFTRELLVGRLR